MGRSSPSLSDGCGEDDEGDDEDDDDVSSTSSTSGLRVKSPSGNRQGVMAPIMSVIDATNNNLTGLDTRLALTNSASMAPILPDAAHTPKPVDLTAVGKRSEVMQSMVFHAAMAQAWKAQAERTIPICQKSVAKYANAMRDAALASMLPMRRVVRPVRSMR
eukprot:CAMPEP_0202443036 /NCGR_PEP_ID=MMETSP1360-20130828/2390_1 /ASSEMBLY_ACC=CAM_ASM_000848 /TAXON_ID=515479 /ORGANISM="Licmophora paradoxa, Strain CCMP2313" /LENGTH=160 /DNA_ID=CAMNT_0049058603 /DNA_START=45 /DNA_END=527 /DNA_ORIENTATION=+